MKNILPYFILTPLIAIVFGCGTAGKEGVTDEGNQSTVKIDSLPRKNHLKETFNEEDLPVNDHLTEKLKPIRANFKRINSIRSWTVIIKKDLWETTEGGEAKFYYLNGQLEKITARRFGETFQQLTEYYLLNGKLSFVFERSFRYNRHIYYDSVAMKDNNDTETFDLESSKIIEDRSYFENGKLLHQLNNQDCGSPFAEDYLQEEQKRITSEFEKLMKLNLSPL